MARPLSCSWSSLVYQRRKGGGRIGAQRRVAAVLNPRAGNGRASERWHALAWALKARGVQTEAFVTRAPGDGTLLTKEAIARGHDTVLAVGGDGTVHEVVNGLWQVTGALQSIRLGIVPAGTGMDIARNLALPQRVDEIAARLLNGSERLIDLGVMGDGAPVFVNFAETGIGSQVVAREHALPSMFSGRATYLLAALQSIGTFVRTAGSVSVDGVEMYNGSYVSVVVANGMFLAGGMRMAPHARVDDGLFDVIILGDFSRPELIAHIWKTYPGTHLAHPKVLWSRGSSVQIVSEQKTVLDLDGELYPSKNMTFQMHQQALRVRT